MFKSKIAILISTMFIILFSGHLMAASHQIDMLNKLGKERMVFSKKVISVDVNDDVLWKSVNKGHNVEFMNERVSGVFSFNNYIFHPNY